jgi:hypothetical protein
MKCLELLECCDQACRAPARPSAMEKDKDAPKRVFNADLNTGLNKSDCIMAPLILAQESTAQSLR